MGVVVQDDGTVRIECGGCGTRLGGIAGDMLELQMRGREHAFPLAAILAAPGSRTRCERCGTYLRYDTLALPGRLRVAAPPAPAAAGAAPVAPCGQCPAAGEALPAPDLRRLREGVAAVLALLAQMARHADEGQRLQRQIVARVSDLPRPRSGPRPPSLSPTAAATAITTTASMLPSGPTAPAEASSS